MKEKETPNCFSFPLWVAEPVIFLLCYGQLKNRSCDCMHAAFSSRSEKHHYSLVAHSFVHISRGLLSYTGDQRLHVLRLHQEIHQLAIDHFALL